ncbi:MAG TPA: Na(+)/H(+) antiporter NhaA, partial [Bacteroidales bacterium]|nr:Na(+)/H(+) antiporter NhaA [Bacteroidales bacterium]
IMWYFIYNSGIHPTITGVLVAFAIPFRKSKEVSCSRRLELFLHNPVSFFVIPLFALANTAIRIEGDFSSTILQPYSIGIILGLFLGKPFGIWLMSLIGVKLKLCTLPIGLKFKHIFSVGIIAGIGFTMSIFITLLAFNDITIQNNAKFSILIASLLAAITGLITLKLTLKAKTS